jgi:pyruvate, orthophosphate dikinase
MNVAEGILTARGGMTSHAAVVARGMGKCCISGAGSIKIDYKARTMVASGKKYKEGDFFTQRNSPAKFSMARSLPKTRTQRRFW